MASSRFYLRWMPGSGSRYSPKLNESLAKKGATTKAASARWRLFLYLGQFQVSFYTPYVRFMLLFDDGDFYCVQPSFNVHDMDIDPFDALLHPVHSFI